MADCCCAGKKSFDPGGYAQNSLPFVVGITGHRDLRPEDVPALEKAVEEIFGKLRDELPHTPLLLLSPLAEGADRLAARVALRLRMRLVVALPMPEAEYLKDFDDVSKEEYRRLRDQAESVIDLGLVPGYTLQDLRTIPDVRNKHYQQVGVFVAHYSQVLVALWDGVKPEPEKVGGTPQIVRFELEGAPPDVRIPRIVCEEPLDAPEVGPVYHVVTPRASNPTPQGTPFTLCRLYPKNKSAGDDAAECDDDAAKRYYSQIFRRLDEFNVDAEKLARRYPQRIAGAQEEILADVSPQARQWLAPLAQQYARADSLAVRFQRLYKRISMAIAAIAVASIVALQVYNEFWTGPGVILGYLVLWLLALGCYFLAHRRRWEERWLDNRALAEGLRVQVYWLAAGCRRWVVHHYLQKRRSELDWIRNVMRTCMLMPGMLDTRPTASAGDFAVVVKKWVRGQQEDFFIPKEKKKRRTNCWLCGIKLVLVWASVAIALVHLVLHFQTLLSPDAVATIRHALNVLLGLFISGAGALEFYQSVGEYAEEAELYRSMGEIFGRATLLLDKRGAGRTTGTHLLFRLGRESLEEHSDWLMMHRNQLDAPLPG